MWHKWEDRVKLQIPTKQSLIQAEVVQEYCRDSPNTFETWSEFLFLFFTKIQYIKLIKFRCIYHMFLVWLTKNMLFVTRTKFEKIVYFKKMSSLIKNHTSKKTNLDFFLLKLKFCLLKKRTTNKLTNNKWVYSDN